MTSVAQVCGFPDFHIYLFTFDNAINNDCVSFGIVNTCTSQICSDCVIVKYGEPRYAVTTVKIPGDRLLSAEIFYQALDLQAGQLLVNQIGSPRCEGVDVSMDGWALEGEVVDSLGSHPCFSLRDHGGERGYSRRVITLLGDEVSRWFQFRLTTPRWKVEACDLQAAAFKLGRRHIQSGWLRDGSMVQFLMYPLKRR